MTKHNFIITLIMAGVLMASPAWAISKSGANHQANLLFSKEEYEKAAELYRKALKADPENPALNYNLGGALYKLNKPEQAVEHLQKALLSDDNALKERAYYNLGNAYYQNGKALSATKIDAAIPALENSLISYESALKLNDKDEDARYNHKFVEAELKRLKEQKQKQQQKQNQQENGQGKSDQKESQKKQNSSEQEQKEKQPSPGNEENQQKQPGQEQTPSPTPAEQGQSKSEEQNKSGQGEEQKKPEDKGAGQSEQKPEDKQNQTGQAAGAENSLSKEEARMMLNDYEQNEEPKGMINFIKRQGRESPVLRDW